MFSALDPAIFCHFDIAPVDLERRSWGIGEPCLRSVESSFGKKPVSGETCPPGDWRLGFGLDLKLALRVVASLKSIELSVDKEAIWARRLHCET